MRQVTLVSLYGEKPKEFKALVAAIWKIIDESRLRCVFRPYDMRQIHGTLAGMERVPGYRIPFNANIRQSSGAMTEMRFDTFKSTVCRRLPMNVQIGGFPENHAPFKSFGKDPYVRSFQVQWPSKKVTVIGWPFDISDGTRSYANRPLFDLRCDLEGECRSQHKYPRPMHEDNDLFMVIGELVNLHMLTDAELQEVKTFTIPVEKTVRDMLSTESSIDVTLSVDRVFVAHYSNETLPLETTDVYCLADDTVDAFLIRGLYS